MTKFQAEQTAQNLRKAGWPIVTVEQKADGTWRAVAEDFGLRNVHLRESR